MKILPGFQIIFRTLLFLGLALIPLSVPAEAAPGANRELVLYKVDPYLYGACGWCTDLFSLKENDNRKDFYSYNRYNQTGYYEIQLKGPAGTTVTLFGDRDHSLKRGYLILVKKDARPIEVGDLGNLPPRQWVELGTPQTGVYSVWYHPASSFKERIASVRWGQWWSELPPANQ